MSEPRPTARREWLLNVGDRWFLRAIRIRPDAFHRGIERRLDAGLDPQVDSVASVFISRWDTAIAHTAPLESCVEPTLHHDSSTNNLIRRYRKQKDASR
jgi:hypothetical protein